MNETTLIPILDKYSIKENEIIKIGDEIVNNNIIIKYNYIPTDFSKVDQKLRYNKTFSWEINLGSFTNMAMLHLHSLEPISYLLLAYDLKNEINYLNKAYEILFDWYEYSRNADHFYLWYRHCVADRAIVISQLYYLKDKVSLNTSELDKLYKLIFNHKNYLSQDLNYVKHNHGTLMDMGLLALGIVSEDKLTINFSTNRLRENFLDTFTDNMICVENSVSYSVYNIEQFLKCQKYLLEPLDKTLDDDFDNKIYQALNFFKALIQPDGGFPHLGDGEKIDIEYLKSLKLYEFYKDHTLFSKETDTEIFSKVYYKEGYVILKNYNNYIFITAGDIKKNHKHADDLSFVLYYGEEVFIDPGIYSYDNNSLREYQTSSRAHNTVELNNETYKYITNNQDDTGISLFKEFDNYFYVLMKNSSYDYAEIHRHFYVLKSDFTILIQDEVFSQDKILASQFFNLSPANHNELELGISSRQIIVNNNLKIRYDHEAFYELYTGENPYNINAIYSRKFHHYEPISKIRISKYDKNPKLTTVISKSLEKKFDIKKNDNHSDKIEISIDEKIIELEKKKIEIEVSKYNKIPRLEIDRKGNTIYGKTMADYYEEQEYAWDILKRGEKEKLIWYQDDNNFEYTFHNSGEYTIRYYIRNKNNYEEKLAFINERKIII